MQIHVDDLSRNFELNPLIGLLIKPFFIVPPSERSVLLSESLLSDTSGAPTPRPTDESFSDNQDGKPRLINDSSMHIPAVDESSPFLFLAMTPAAKTPYRSAFRSSDSTPRNKFNNIPTAPSMYIPDSPTSASQPSFTPRLVPGALSTDSAYFTISPRGKRNGLASAGGGGGDDDIVMTARSNGSRTAHDDVDGMEDYENDDELLALTRLELHYLLLLYYLKCYCIMFYSSYVCWLLTLDCMYCYYCRYLVALAKANITFIDRNHSSWRNEDLSGLSMDDPRPILLATTPSPRKKKKSLGSPVVE